ncbi:MAG: hypothetical protein AAF485_19690, partial [Chloroflexota bacterium]
LSFNLIYFVGDIFVFFIPVWLFITLWIGVGIFSISHNLAHRFATSKTYSTESPILNRFNDHLKQRAYELTLTGLASLFILFPLILTIIRFPAISLKETRSIGERWQTILSEPIPDGSILISNDRNEIMPMWYYQYVEQQRPDLKGLFPLIVPGPDYRHIGQVLDQALASGRPVYFIKPMDGLNLKANLTPAGTLYKAEAYNTEPSRLLDITLPEITINDGTHAKQESVTLVGYDINSSDFTRNEEILVTLYWRTSQPLSIDYTSYVHLINEQGQGMTQNDHKPGGDFYASRAWQPGEVLHDTHRLIIPTDIPKGTYQFRAGLYYQPKPGVFEQMGNGVEFGQIKITF